MKAVLFASLLIACARADAHVGPHPEAGVAFEQHLGAQVDLALPFLSAQGTREALAQAIDQHPTVLMLGYVRCEDLCSVALPGVAQALDRSGLVAGRDYRALFASIDAREGPDVLRQANERLPAGARAAWTFLGGNEPSVHALAKAVGFHYRYEPGRDAFAHPEGIVVLTREGRISRYFFGASFDPSKLRQAITQAGQGTTGSLSDRLLLLCYHFDPATGRYTPRILETLRILVALCAVAAAACAWRLVSPKRGGGGA